MSQITIDDTARVVCGVGRVPLRGRDGSVRAWAEVDAEDLARVATFRWHLHSGRPCRNVGTRHLKETLADFVLGIPQGSAIGVVTADGDPLNCRRDNLVLNKRLLLAAL